MQILKKIMIVALALLPSLIWVLDSQSHLIKSDGIQSDITYYQHMKRISTGSYPFLTKDAFFLVSISDPYVYEFSRDGQELIERYDVGGREKFIIKEDDVLKIAYQNIRIKNNYSALRTFNLTDRSMDRILGPIPVKGPFKENVVLFDGKIIFRSVEKDHFVFHSYSNGVLVRSVLPKTPEENGGFHLSLPNSNIPVFEIEGGEGEEGGLWNLASGSPKQISSYSELGVDTESLNKNENFSNYFLTQKGVLAVKRETTVDLEEKFTETLEILDLMENTKEDLKFIEPKDYKIENLTDHSQLTIRSYMTPGHVMDAKGDYIKPTDEEIVLQQKVADSFSQKLEENKMNLENYKRTRKLGDYLFTPTSVSLIILQILTLAMAIKVGKGKHNDVR